MEEEEEDDDDDEMEEDDDDDEMEEDMDDDGNYKNSIKNKFIQSQPFRTENSPELKIYGFSPIGQESDQYKYKLVYKKIFLMSICILFEYLSLYFDE